MQALGEVAFHPSLSPSDLRIAAAQLRPTQEDDADDYEAFALDFATIRNLPEVKR